MHIYVHAYTGTGQQVGGAVTSVAVEDNGEYPLLEQSRGVGSNLAQLLAGADTPAQAPCLDPLLGVYIHMYSQYACACTHICIHHVHAYAHTCMHMHMHATPHASHTHAYTYTNACIHMCMCMTHKHAHAYTYACIHTCMYSHACIRTCSTCMCAAIHMCMHTQVPDNKWAVQ